MTHESICGDRVHTGGVRFQRTAPHPPPRPARALKSWRRSTPGWVAQTKSRTGPAVPAKTQRRKKVSKFSNYEYRKQPGFDMNTFEGANQAIPMKTLVIYCFDPRAVEIPRAVAEYFGDEVYPGENILDESGTRVGHTRTLFTETNAGGRAAFALESVAAMDYIFSVQNVVVVHHSFCGTTTLTPELLIEEFHDHHHADISMMFDHDSLAIMDFEESLKYVTSSCFARARQCRNMSSCTASSTKSVPAS